MLDPRFKLFDFKRVDPELRASARNWLIENYVKNWAPAIEVVSDDDEEPEERPAKKAKKPSQNFLDSDSDEEDSDAGEDAAPAEEGVEGDGESPARPPVKQDPRKEEVMKYLALPQVLHTEDFDLLSWWKAHQSLFPNLAKMARQYLALPASSAGVERLFSSAGTMHDKKRKRTSEHTLSMMLNIKVNAD